MFDKKLKVVYINTMLMQNVEYFSDAEYNDFCKYIYETVGINLTEKKKSLVSNRLRKRITTLNLASYGEYFKYIRLPQNSGELINCINAITTNVSSFFRDTRQFQTFVEDVIPIFTKENRKNKINIWSAGCSTGEEPYTISIQMNEYFGDVPFSILASDLSTKVLDIAKLGNYSQEQLKTVEPGILKKYFTDNKNDTYTIKPILKQNIRFESHNLMHDKFPTNMDIIFCRNVIIYFDRDTKNSLFNKFHSTLKVNGFLFLGHSESLFNDKRFSFYKPSIYRKIGESV